MSKELNEELLVVKPINEFKEEKEKISFESWCKMGKVTQTRSLLTNPKSKYYNPTIAKRRAKEKNRRKVNKLKRR